MIARTKRAARRSVVALLSLRRRMALLKMMSRAVGIDLMEAAYAERGIMQYRNDEESGERHLINSVLPDAVRSSTPVLMDVGANSGRYSLALANRFPNARIFALEPNAETFEKLKRNVGNKVRCFSVGLAATSGSQNLYTYENDRISEHATKYHEVFTDLHHTTAITPISINVTTLDDFCVAESISFIDFLKIDTEGGEMEVLQGGKLMLSENRVGIIQFEFNEMNVISRVFLRDFYELLHDFRIYRLQQHALRPLPRYDSSNEIFRFQNLLAVSRKFHPTQLA